MARQVLFQTALEDTDTEAIDILGALRDDEFGRVYRYIRNDAATSLVKCGCCLANLSSAVADVDKAVYSPDAATGGATALMHIPGGMPMTAIGPTGSDTGCFGWVQVAGKARVNLLPSATAVDQEPGCCAIATSSKPATSPWGRPLTGTIDSTAGGTVNLRCIQLAGLVDTVTTLGTAVSAAAYIRCLP